MEIITNGDVYSNVTSAEKKAQRQAKKASKPKGQGLKNLLNNPFVKGAIGGVADTAKTWSQNSNVQFDPSTSTADTTYKAQDGSKLPEVKGKEPMSTTTKVVIGLVVVGAIGAGVYFAFFKKKAKGSTKAKK